MAEIKHIPHILPFRLYIIIGSALLALTAITVWVSMYDLGSMNIVIAMTVASVKGILVLLFFMHLKYTDKLYSIAFAAAIVILGLFITFTMFDTLYRGEVDPVKGSTIKAQAAMYRTETKNDLAADSTVVPDSSSAEDNDHK